MSSFGEVARADPPTAARIEHLVKDMLCDAYLSVYSMSSPVTSSMDQLIEDLPRIITRRIAFSLDTDLRQIREPDRPIHIIDIRYSRVDAATVPCNDDDEGTVFLPQVKKTKLNHEKCR